MTLYKTCAWILFEWLWVYICLYVLYSGWVGGIVGKKGRWASIIVYPLPYTNSCQASIIIKFLRSKSIFSASIFTTMSLFRIYCQIFIPTTEDILSYNVQICILSYGPFFIRNSVSKEKFQMVVTSFSLKCITVISWGLLLALFCSVHS